MHPFQKQDCSVHPIPENLPQSSQPPESAPSCTQGCSLPLGNMGICHPTHVPSRQGPHPLRKVTTMLCLDSSKEGRGFGSFCWVALPFLTTAPAKKSVSASRKAPRPVAHRIFERTGVNCLVCSEVWGCRALRGSQPFHHLPTFYFFMALIWLGITQQMVGMISGSGGDPSPGLVGWEKSCWTGVGG